MSRNWNLAYASHLGYLSPDEPLFRASVPSRDPWDHVAFAADIGLSGVLYPWAISRPAEEVDRFHAALEHFQLLSSVIVYAPLGRVTTPIWVRSDGWDDLARDFERSVPLAQRLGAPMLAVLVQGIEGAPVDSQEDVLVDNLRRAGDLAAKSGIVIGVEHMVALPGMLLRSTEQAVRVFDRISHPNVQLIFDTGHVQEMDGNVLGAYRQARRHVGLLQLADMPGRVQPGSGVIDFETLLREVRSDGLGETLIDLEHGWTSNSVDVEQAGIRAMRRIDSTLDSIEEHS
ncbi:sugar phosphate isomerase/epimerase family protein [Mesorhizobium kowhaii]|uniref:Xylose isomerase-like TIM barrel domain-containing protein n=1 Tax=Mesorhizobium kowhaii TaxID=1300272 RepID=A0A2W7CYB4_9HYPH|nr:sugar phosphate isomerase/epimerase family protein [Mesorhizobium kowhaii]PZV38799.1 hypothetical protein B5V02_09090 [Mesorhizobium kowhaii]